MSAENNKALVRRLVDEGQTNGNLSIVDELLADDFVDHTPFAGLPPTRDGVKAVFGYLRAAMPDLHVSIEEQIADEAKVVTRKTFHGTHRGELLGVPATGRAVSFEVIDILTVRDGKIADHRVIFDQLGIRAQLGA